MELFLAKVTESLYPQWWEQKGGDQWFGNGKQTGQRAVQHRREMMSASMCLPPQVTYDMNILGYIVCWETLLDTACICSALVFLDLCCLLLVLRGADLNGSVWSSTPVTFFVLTLWDSRLGYWSFALCSGDNWSCACSQGKLPQASIAFLSKAAIWPPEYGTCRAVSFIGIQTKWQHHQSSKLNIFSGGMQQGQGHRTATETSPYVCIACSIFKILLGVTNEIERKQKA